MRLDVKEIISSDIAISKDRGKILYDRIVRELKEQDEKGSKEEILVDFSEVKKTITTFFNECYGMLYKEYDRDFIEKYIRLVNLKPIGELQLKNVRENALSFFVDSRKEVVAHDS